MPPKLTFATPPFEVLYVVPKVHAHLSAFSAPLVLLLAFMTLRGVVDMPVLFAIALWRSAMGGLFDILPALVLQVAFCFLLVWCARAFPLRRRAPS